MDASETIINDEGPARKYYGMIPHMIWDLGLSPYALCLYAYFKRVATENGVCYKGIRTIASETGMGVASVTRAKQELLRWRLIFITKKRARTKEGSPIGQPVHHVTVRDIWAINMTCYSQKRSSLDRLYFLKKKLGFIESDPGGIASDPPGIASDPEGKQRIILKKNPKEEKSADADEAQTTKEERLSASPQPPTDTEPTTFEEFFPRPTPDSIAVASPTTPSDEYSQLVRLHCEALGRTPPNGKVGKKWARQYQEIVKAVGNEYGLDQAFPVVLKALQSLAQDEGYEWNWLHTWLNPWADSFKAALSTRVGQMLKTTTPRLVVKVPAWANGG